MNQHMVRAIVDIAVEAESQIDANKAAFDLVVSCRQPTKRGPKSGSAPRASVTGVTIDSSGRHVTRRPQTDESDVSLVSDALERA